MTSPLVDFFGGPGKIRSSIREEIVEYLKRINQLDTSPKNPLQYFRHDWSRALDSEVRNLRKTGKRRHHIFNYERAAAQHIWHDTVYFMADTHFSPLAIYHSGDKVMTVNNQHHAILVKILESVMAYDWPEVTVVLLSLEVPRYQFGQAEVEERQGMSIDNYATFAPINEQIFSTIRGMSGSSWNLTFDDWVESEEDL